jgi:hypothetical protein
MRNRLPLSLLGLVIAIIAVAGSAGAHSGASAKNARAATSVPRHIATWAFDDECDGGADASRALVRRWLTYAESNCGPRARKALRDCHAGGIAYCKTMQYVDSDWNFNSANQESALLASAASPNWWLHIPNQSARIYSSSFGGGFALNQSNAAVRSYFHSFVRRHYDAADGLMMDWQTPSLSQQFYFSSCSCTSSNEIHTSGALRYWHGQMSAAITHRNGAPFIQVDNTLPPNPFLPQGLDMLNRSTGVVAWSVEGEPMDSGQMVPYYTTLLDQIAYIATRTSGFIVPMSRAPYGAPYVPQTRRVQEATILLGFTPGHIVDWANIDSGSRHLGVWPEEGIYPTAPIESMRAPGGRGCLKGTGHVCSTGGHNSIRVARGIFRREFSACYREGAPFGACAAIVNTTGHAVTVRARWLRIRYRHLITFNGGDVESGGTVALRGASFTPGATTIAAHDAILLAP